MNKSTDQDDNNTLQPYLRYLRYELQLATTTCTTYIRILNQLEKYSNKPLHQLSNEDAQSLLRSEHLRGLNPRTLIQHRAALRSYAKWYAQQHGKTAQLSDSIKIPKVRTHPLPDTLSPEEISQLLTPPGPELDDPLACRDHAIGELFYSTGLRLAELAALNIDCIGKTHLSIRGKGGKVRNIYIGSKAQAALLRWRKSRLQWSEINHGDTPLFISARGTRLSHRALQLAMKRLAAKNLPGRNIHPHQLRHSFASHILQSSQDIRSVQELLGHSNLSSTQIYTHLDFQHLSNIYHQSHPRAAHIPSEEKKQND